MQSAAIVAESCLHRRPERCGHAKTEGFSLPGFVRLHPFCEAVSTGRFFPDVGVDKRNRNLGCLTAFSMQERFHQIIAYSSYNQHQSTQSPVTRSKLLHTREKFLRPTDSGSLCDSPLPLTVPCSCRGLSVKGSTMSGLHACIYIYIYIYILYLLVWLLDP